MWGLFRHSTLLLLLVLPFTGHAAVFEFTHIEYDPPGSDKGREWVAVLYTGTTTIPIAELRLLEGGVSHRILAQESSSIFPGETIIIATNPTTYSAENGSSKKVFKSSFSLNYTGESLAIVTGTSTMLGSTTYRVEPKLKKPVLAHSDDFYAVTKNRAPQVLPEHQVALSKEALPQAQGGEDWRWFLLLGGLLVVGMVALFMIQKPQNEATEKPYTIIDISDRTQ